MNPALKSILLRLGGSLANYGWGRMVAPRPSSIHLNRMEHLDRLIQAIPDGEIAETKLLPATESRVVDDRTIPLPTTEETVKELKRRLGKELYRLEMDLQGGARFAGKPCDCLEYKHKLGLEAITEELMSYETEPIYGEIVTWLNRHEYPPEEVLKHPPEYFQKLAPELRQFRKRVMGTESPQALLKQEASNDDKKTSPQGQET